MPAMREKRKFPRAESQFPVKYRDLRKPDEGFRGTESKNISEGGVRFRSDRFISLACRLVVEFYVPSISTPIRAISKVAWIKKLPTGDDYEMGNQFLEITREHRELIRKLVKEKSENLQKLPR